MYSINKDRRFFRKDLYTGNVHTFSDYDAFLLEVFLVLHSDMLGFIIPEQFAGKIPKIYDINVSGDDVSDNFLRRWLYADGFGRNIDIRDYDEDALKRFGNKSEKEIFQRQEQRTEYRRGPIPLLREYIGKKGFRSLSHGLRRNLQFAADPEYGTYIRRGAIPTEIVDIRSRRTHESWKKQKKRRQWEKAG